MMANKTVPNYTLVIQPSDSGPEDYRQQGLQKEDREDTEEFKYHRLGLEKQEGSVK